MPAAATLLDEKGDERCRDDDQVFGCVRGWLCARWRTRVTTNAIQLSTVQ